MSSIQLANGPGFSVDLVFDENTKTASVIQIDNSKGEDIITFWAVINGAKTEEIANPGEEKQIIFPLGKRTYSEPDLSSIGKPGVTGFKVDSLDSYGIVRNTGKEKFERQI